ncbi:MAG: lipocalin family protein [Oscillospiraceae bacterium]|jgi:hypothetical protein
MAKKWKPVALVMSILLMMGMVLTGCGGNNADPIVGKWKLTNMEVGGATIDVQTFIEEYAQGEDASQMDISFEMKEDGVFTGLVAGEAAEGTWKKEADGYTLTVDGQDQSATVKDGKLVFEEDGMKMIFTKA